MKKIVGILVCMLLITTMFSGFVMAGDEEKNATPTDDAVELYLWGGFGFHYKVVNQNNESLPCKITFNMKNSLVTYNTWSFNFTVDPNDEYSNFVDCYPMLFYRIEVLLSESGGNTLKRTGITIAGFNIYLTKEMFYNQDWR